MNTGNTDTPILAVVAGNGLVADAAAQAKADYVLALNAGTYQTAGIGSLAAFMPYADANAQLITLLKEQILPRPQHLPVIAGVLAHDPNRSSETFINELKELGVSGICNWPAIGFIDGHLRSSMEAEGIGIEKELVLLQIAKQQGLQSCAFVCNPEDAEILIQAEPNIIIANLGLTKQQMHIERRDRVAKAAQAIQAIKEHMQAAKSQAQLLVFGGPINDAHDLRELQQHVHIDGFAGGSIFERLPVSDIISSTIKQFRTALINENELQETSPYAGLRGHSTAMQQVYDMIKRVAPHDVHVCIEGESGTGKELIANAIQQLSPRSHKAFVTVNCGAIPDHLLESELFGHVAGAFTGAMHDREGKFSLAHRGTLFLDEIADLSPHGQVALLRAIQQREICAVGSDQTQANDVRIICASNQSLKTLVDKGAFRSDLYYRLSSFTMQVPALRQRPDDIEELVAFFLRQLSVEINREIIGCTEHFLKRLKRHQWPGNVRELQHVLRRAAILEDGTLLAGSDFIPDTQHTDHDDRKQRAEQAVHQHQGNKLAAAKSLNISRKTLYQWLRLNT